MKALVLMAGRGLGGDAVVTLNVIRALEERGVQCELALDENSPGVLFKKKGYTWHKIKIPQAGGHAATKLSAMKAAFKMLTATFKVRRLIKKLDVDFIVGVIGGGAIVGSVGAKLSNTPAASVICTPLDSKVCSKFNPCFALPETSLFRQDVLPDNIQKTYFPINADVNDGNAEVAFKKLKEEPLFDENKKTILFSSGSSIFKGIIDAANKFAEYSNGKYNLLLIGLPLKDDYLDGLHKDIVYLGYVDWLKDLYAFLDLAVLTDDGLMVEESVACELPTVALTRVKWGRYHNMAGIFEGAVIESELDESNEKIMEALNNLDSLKEASKKYSSNLVHSKEILADKILEAVKK